MELAPGDVVEDLHGTKGKLLGILGKIAHIQELGSPNIFTARASDIKPAKSDIEMNDDSWLEEEEKAESVWVCPFDWPKPPLKIDTPETPETSPELPKLPGRFTRAFLEETPTETLRALLEARPDLSSTRRKALEKAIAAKSK